MNIPGLPQIPTDNLYKFASVSGLLFTMVALGAAFWLAGDVQQEMHGEDARMSALSKAADQQHQAVLHYDSVASDSKQEQDAHRRFDSARKASTHAVVELDRFIEEERPIRWRRFLDSFLCLLIALLGATFTVYSFLQWYLRHQVFQDRLLIAEVERAELEVQRLKREVVPDVPPLSVPASDETTPPASEITAEEARS